MLVTHTHISKDKVTGEARTKTIEMRAESLGLPETFVQESATRWVMATETKLLARKHIVTVTH